MTPERIRENGMVHSQDKPIFLEEVRVRNMTISERGHVPYF
jgi:hypothetical protein